MKVSVFFVMTLFVGFAQAETIHVAVASNFAQPMRTLAREFEKESGHRLVLSIGSSGKLYAQIRHGAPYHLFFSADQAKPVALEKAGSIVENSRSTYAIGILALWAKNRNDSSALHLLKQGQFSRLAIANPRFAPYGVAAKQVLLNLKLAEKTQARWIMGENIGQTYQFVHSGNADLGFVALSQVMEDGKMAPGAMVVPGNLYTPIKQDFVLLKKGEKNPAANALMRFVKELSAQEIIRSYGYQTPPKV
ncbi:molybdate ABC transporter substrate-binding protein [Teredinibacter sp. KSP-S5-2]|uniref:molybdate ABC transporter substrate-binding protein n=1 Tax=Teredinibacter sp. KSP-S5-2 TaxID=3034506 RepID=UPI0029353142|nr:molybdate ABC transporter substrate-binding protein [Teredinibacter sp. KSP-S5-2]WNO11409.1 molybdate ABC transporter substrate-binding protein [Teredinibacter sp. KSP-S5-2]